LKATLPGPYSFSSSASSTAWFCWTGTRKPGFFFKTLNFADVRTDYAVVYDADVVVALTGLLLTLIEIRLWVRPS
jgi:hypothetical protein